MPGARVPETLPPVLLPGPSGSLALEIGDLFLNTTINGVPAAVVVSVISDVDVTVDASSSVASFQVVGAPAKTDVLVNLNAGNDKLMGSNADTDWSLLHRNEGFLKGPGKAIVYVAGPSW